MEIRSSAYYIRVSPRKIRLIADAIRHLAPQAALDRLSSVNKHAAAPMAKVVKSSLANAVNNAKLSEDILTIDRIEVNEGPTFKRWRPVSRGMAHGYAKRTSHITVVLKTTKDIDQKRKETKREKNADPKETKPGKSPESKTTDQKNVQMQERKPQSLFRTGKEQQRKEALHVRRSERRSRNAL